MLPLSKWENQDKSHSRGRELLGQGLERVARFHLKNHPPDPVDLSAL